MDEIVIQGFGPSRIRFWHRLTHPWDRRVFFNLSMIVTLPDERTVEPQLPGVTNYADGTALADFLDGLDPNGWDGALVWMSTDRDIAVTALFTDQIQLTWRLWSKEGWTTDMHTPLPPGLADALRDFLTGPEPVDPAVINEGLTWGRRAVDRAAWSAPMCAPAWQVALARASVGPGTALLDMACGSGEFCAEAACRGADVIGIDASHTLVGLAEENYPAAEFHVWPLGPLPWHDRSFDVVTAFNALFFAPDPQAAFAEACRVSKNYVIVCSWHPQLPSDLLTVARTVRGPSPHRHPELPAPQEELVIDVPLEFPEQDTMLRSLLSVGSFQRLIQHEGEDVVAEKIRVAAMPYRRPAADNFRYDNSDGYRLDNKFLMQIFRV